MGRVHYISINSHCMQDSHAKMSLYKCELQPGCPEQRLHNVEQKCNGVYASHTHIAESIIRLTMEVLKKDRGELTAAGGTVFNHG